MIANVGPLVAGIRLKSDLELTGTDERYAWCRHLVRSKAEVKMFKPPMDGLLYAGYDPGSRNAGLAFLVDGEITAYQIEWDDAPTPALGLQYAYNMIGHLIDTFGKLSAVPMAAVVENAAISRGGSSTTTGLAENRAVATLAFASRYPTVERAAPNSIAKAVLGSGKLRAKNVWGHLFGEDGASAVAAALMATLLEKEQ